MPQTKEKKAEAETKVMTTNDDQWFDDSYEGQLAVDVFQDHANNVVIVSTVAGVSVQDLDISINNDMVTIRGKRRTPFAVDDGQYYYQECYWGGFSRSIILPVDVKAEEAKASLKHGILTITIPKTDSVQVKVVRVDDKESA